MDEPSLLDYLEDKLKMHKPGTKTPGDEPPQPGKPESGSVEGWQKTPWSSILAVIFALAGQRFLEPTLRNVEFAVVFFAIAAGFLVRALLTREWQIAPLKRT